MNKTLTLNMNTTALTIPSVTIYGTEICTVLAVTVEEAGINTANAGSREKLDERKIIDRLDQWMNLAGKNDNKVTVECGIAVGLLNKARKREADIGKRTLTKIIETYPEINPSWLLHGTGQMVKVAPVKEMSVKTLRHLHVRSSQGRILTLEDHGGLQDYGKVYTNAVDLYEIREILAALSANRPDGKIKIDKPAIITLKKAGLRFLHPDTGEEMNVRDVFTALSNMAAEKASNLKL